MLSDHTCLFSLCLCQRSAQRRDSETVLTLWERVTIWKASDIQNKEGEATRQVTPHVEKAHRPSVLGNAGAPSILPQKCSVQVAEWLLELGRASAPSPSQSCPRQLH